MKENEEEKRKIKKMKENERGYQWLNLKYSLKLHDDKKKKGRGKKRMKEKEKRWLVTKFKVFFKLHDHFLILRLSI